MDQSSGAMPSAEEVLASYHLPPTKPLWLNANYGKHIVKGNFLTLSAKPKTVEMGEWVAHQGKCPSLAAPGHDTDPYNSC